MGIPFRLYFGGLAIVQIGILGLLTFTVVEQQSIRNQLVDLTEELQFHQGASGVKASGGSGDPNPSGVFETFGKGDPPKIPEVGPFHPGGEVSHSWLVGLSWLFATLFLLVVLGFTVQIRQRQAEQREEPISPISHRQLAQRQLAELRLRHNGFGQ